MLRYLGIGTLDSDPEGFFDWMEQSSFFQDLFGEFLLDSPDSDSTLLQVAVVFNVALCSLLCIRSD